MKRKSILVLAIILMSIGFAAVSTTLFINGNTNVASNTSDFDVYFSKTFENGIEKNILIKDKTHIAFTANLSKIDEVYELKYEVTNASKNYDVSVSLNVPNGNEYIRVTNDFDTSNLLARTKREGVLTLKVIKGVTEELNLPIEITITVNGVERTELGGEAIRGETTYKEKILNGADPVLKNELIPVAIADSGEVTYADTHTKWYSYEEKNWANAVILDKDVDTSSYVAGKTVIPEDDIESYFVWIPKYKYQIFYMNGADEVGGAKEIQIEFTTEETDDTDTSCVSPKIAGESGTCSVGKWMTHPAFQNFGVTGLWVGKFETGYKGATSNEDAKKNIINDIKDNKIIVKPNVYSWRNNTVGNFFKSFLNYKTELNSHMMKNTEWGAVAILSHSKYGINTEVTINGNSNFLTGFSNSTNQYNTEAGYKASTTGNITGVYDMSGGSWEYVAASRGVGESGFTKAELTQYAQYIDTYPVSGDDKTYTNRILGDATGEMGPFSSDRNSWYADHSAFIDSTLPWFARGSTYSDGSIPALVGQFSFNSSTGIANSVIGARLVLAVK